MSRVAPVLYLLAAAVCVLLGAVLAVMGLVVLVTKLTSLPEPRAVLFIVGFALAAFACFWAANRLRRASLSKIKA